jgi:hypothetical protein
MDHSGVEPRIDVAVKIEENMSSNVKGGINLQEEDTILQYQERLELSILDPSFHPRIYER